MPNWCPNYDWGDRQGDVSAGNVISPYGYYYRNCTDYAAWKVSSLGVPADRYKGLGDAKTWAARAPAKGVRVDAVPAVGSVAVRTTGTFGHTAFVEEVRPDGTIRVSQYNYRADGNYSENMGTPAAFGFSVFVHFEDFMPRPVPPAQPAPAEPVAPLPPDLPPVALPEEPPVEEATQVLATEETAAVQPEPEPATEVLPADVGEDEVETVLVTARPRQPTPVAPALVQVVPQPQPLQPEGRGVVDDEPRAVSVQSAPVPETPAPTGSTAALVATAVPKMAAELWVLVGLGGCLVLEYLYRYRLLFAVYGSSA